jgi:hypothetical protein
MGRTLLDSLLRLALLQSACFPFFLVFVQAGIERIALVVNAVTELSAGVLAVPVLAPVRAFFLRIAGPDVVQKVINNNY